MAISSEAAAPIDRGRPAGLLLPRRDVTGLQLNGPPSLPARRSVIVIAMAASAATGVSIEKAQRQAQNICWPHFAYGWGGVCAFWWLCALCAGVAASAGEMAGWGSGLGW